MIPALKFLGAKESGVFCVTSGYLRTVQSTSSKVVPQHRLPSSQLSARVKVPGEMFSPQTGLLTTVPDTLVILPYGVRHLDGAFLGKRFKNSSNYQSKLSIS